MVGSDSRAQRSDIDGDGVLDPVRMLVST